MKTKLSFNNFFLVLFTCFTFLAQAQELGDFSPKSSGFKASKVGDGSKKVYISNFSINFEIYKEAIDKKKEGGFGRTIKNAAKAKAAVGLATLSKDAIQQKADQLYADFVADLKAKGYEIITTDAVANTETYKGWKKAVGPAISETDMTGILAVIPSGYSYFYKDRNAFSAKFSALDKTAQNLSKELDDALIADVSLVYVFSAIGTDWNIGNAAKVKLFVNYRLANSFAVSDEKTQESAGGITSFFDKSKQATALSSEVVFTRGKLKIGGSPESQFVGTMKSDMEIAGVLQKDKVVAYSAQTQATATLLNPVVSIRGDNYSETTKWLEPDGEKYAQGMYLAGKKFLKSSVEEALK